MADPHLHVVARAPSGGSLFHSAGAAASLWRRVVAAVPELVALVLLPHRLDLVCLRYRPERFAAALHQQHVSGEGDRHAPLPPPIEIERVDLLRRALCGLYGGPVEAGVAPSPLAWVWCTAREAAGLDLGAMPDVLAVDPQSDLNEGPLQPSTAPDLDCLLSAYAALRRCARVDVLRDRSACAAFLALLRPEERLAAHALLRGGGACFDGPPLPLARGAAGRRSAVLYGVAGDWRFRGPGDRPGGGLAASP